MYVASELLPTNHFFLLTVFLSPQSIVFSSLFSLYLIVICVFSDLPPSSLPLRSLFSSSPSVCLPSFATRTPLPGWWQTGKDTKWKEEMWKWLRVQMGDRLWPMKEKELRKERAQQGGEKQVSATKYQKRAHSSSLPSSPFQHTTLRRLSVFVCMTEDGNRKWNNTGEETWFRRQGGGEGRKSWEERREKRENCFPPPSGYPYCVSRVLVSPSLSIALFVCGVEGATGRPSPSLLLFRTERKACTGEGNKAWIGERGRKREKSSKRTRMTRLLAAQNTIKRKREKSWPEKVPSVLDRLTAQ